MKQVRILALAIASLCFLTDAGAQTCYDSLITSPSPFLGNNDEIFKLSDGSLWQVHYAYEYLYAYSPSVVICPGKNRLIINGKQLQVTRLSQERKRRSSNARAPEKHSSHDSTGSEATDDIADGSGDATGADLIETQIAGTFSGWDGETIFKLSNGQIWQQANYAYLYHYAYSPKVLIFKAGGGYQMQVEGIEQRIRVTRLK